jgi:IMP dehydrogenase
MGLLAAMRNPERGGSPKDRYFQDDAREDALVPQGVEVRCRTAARSARWLKLVGGCAAGPPRRAGHRRAAAARFTQITAAGLTESHPHDIQMTAEAPNYGGRRA